ncbi:MULTISPECIES: hypothetical protein [Pseudomonas]|uniref:Uncharacterized protein n=2 Tax=Pseudomonas syringae group genomosp. 3 TaxID=251701 RepID=A0A0P9LM81_9PSED|nr:MULTISPECIES: hypothetical protein [Pseudomonas]MBF9247864.1 hypothetical protein [Pseudomonas syringae pv. tomato]EGH97008.1 hypothetical protein PLA106_12957 [Pseudomonas amygdali pv. lachrymans str. M302278]KPB87677.1 Uncharacterized protein AC503_3977 [Pseudomonas syringae pv. maculicola]KPW45207.1 hypothetical protein ALO88_101011 [Pseudomonas syringae pv. antirrhini]KTB97652.1 hypothetical protein AO386_15585 [Pseudomonas syringae ICMP 11292]
MNNFTSPALEAPSVPVAESDGLIRVRDLESGISVHFTARGLIKEKDSFELMVNGAGSGVTQIISDPDAPEEVKFVMNLQPEHFAKDGTYAIGYQWLTFPGDIRTDSATTEIRIDRTAPGAALLAPVIFHQINLGNTLTGLVPGYADMQPGDRIQTFCNDRQGPAYVVTSDNLTDRPVPIIFDKEFLLNLHSDSVTISYRVIDRAGNISLPARSVTLSMQV